MKSRVTGLPLFAEWLYPVLDIISSIFFVSVILGCFKDEARTFWIRIITGHIILMFITNYGKTIPIMMKHWGGGGGGCIREGGGCITHSEIIRANQNSVVDRVIEHHCH